MKLHVSLFQSGAANKRAWMASIDVENEIVLEWLVRSERGVGHGHEDSIMWCDGALHRGDSEDGRVRRPPETNRERVRVAQVHLFSDGE